MGYGIGRNNCIIGVENKSSRISLNLELVHRYNVHKHKILSFIRSVHVFFLRHNPDKELMTFIKNSNTLICDVFVEIQ